MMKTFGTKLSIYPHLWIGMCTFCQPFITAEIKRFLIAMESFFACD